MLTNLGCYERAREEARGSGNENIMMDVWYYKEGWGEE